jgi:hypothetical protein
MISLSPQSTQTPTSSDPQSPGIIGSPSLSRDSASDNVIIYAGLIGGLAGASIVFVVVVIVLMCFLWRKQKKSSSSSSSLSSEDPSPMITRGKDDIKRKDMSFHTIHIPWIWSKEHD